jgi:hypothetical protein
VGLSFVPQRNGTGLQAISGTITDLLEVIEAKITDEEIRALAMRVRRVI